MNKTPKNRFKKCVSLIDAVLNELRPPADAWFESIKTEWPTVVGPVIAAETTPERIEGTVLVVKVKSHIWRNELRSGIGLDIVKKVRSQVCRTITQIRWI